MQSDLLNDDHFDTETLPDFQKKCVEEHEKEEFPQPLKPGEVVLLTPDEVKEKLLELKLENTDSDYKIMEINP